MRQRHETGERTMDELISRAMAIDAIVFNSENRFAVDALNDVPAVDAVPVVHGRWEMCGDCGITRCSACKWNFESHIDYKYCPNCGAKTDGERRNDNGKDV